MYFSLIFYLHSLNKNTLNCTHARRILIKLKNAPMYSKKGIPLRHRIMAESIEKSHKFGEEDLVAELQIQTKSNRCILKCVQGIIMLKFGLSHS